VSVWEAKAFELSCYCLVVFLQIVRLGSRCGGDAEIVMGFMNGSDSRIAIRDSFVRHCRALPFGVGYTSDDIQPACP